MNFIGALSSGGAIVVVLVVGGTHHHNHKLRAHTPFPFFVKYVDDLLTSIHPDKLNETLNSLNSFHPKIQFTSEIESNNQINFIDTTVIRNPDNTLSTNWYQRVHTLTATLIIIPITRSTKK